MRAEQAGESALLRLIVLLLLPLLEAPSVLPLHKLGLLHPFARHARPAQANRQAHRPLVRLGWVGWLARRRARRARRAQAFRQARVSRPPRPRRAHTS